MPALEFRALHTSESAARYAVTVPADLLYFEGHFPGAPILPAVAQMLGLVLDRVHAAWPDLGQPRRVARLKFMAKIDPGDDLEVHLDRSDAEVRFALLRRGEACTRGALAFA